MTIDFNVFDLDFPVGSKNKTATLITGDDDAILIDAGFTRADGHRLVAEVLDTGKNLTTIFVSHADPDFYWGLEPLAAAFPDADIVATPLVIDHINAAFEAKLAAWEPVGVNRPTRLVPITPITGDSLSLEGTTFELRAAHELLPDRHYLWQPEQRLIAGGVLLFQAEHVWTADTATAELRAAWISTLDDMAALDPLVAVAGHRLPGQPLDASPIAHTRAYLEAFEEEIARADDAAAVTEALVERYPDAGMLIAAQLGPKVALGEMTWG